MSRAHHAEVHPLAPGQPHFEIHRSALAEALSALGMAAFWTVLWLVFMLALAPPTPARCGPAPGDQEAVRPAGVGALQARSDRLAQPDPGPSARGVATCGPDGAG